MLRVQVRVGRAEKGASAEKGDVLVKLDEEVGV